VTDFWAVIPARRASTRLPDKPLADIGGRPMVVRVAERARSSGASRVIVATDCAQIQSVVQQHGFDAILTRPDHPSGSDRIAEVAMVLCASSEQILVNVQGDEPLIDPALIRDVALLLSANADAAVATAAAPITRAHDIVSPHVVKLVCDERHRALYFSRAPIPFHRDAWPDAAAIVSATPPDGLMRHIGIYAFRAGSLARFVSWPPCPIECAEQLEQLRWLWQGEKIMVHRAGQAPHAGVDTPEDLARVRALWAELNGGTPGAEPSL
jgi:3-deoxy-manno-octulosonate cytidylyltransferase (CMP-KDO synthetase)